MRKLGRHDADNLARNGIHENLSADHGPVSAKSTLPVAVGQQHRSFAPGNLIRRRQQPSDFRLHGERLKQSIADQIREHLFRLGQPGDCDVAGGPNAHGLKRTVLFGVSEIHRRRKSQPTAAGNDAARAGGDLCHIHQFFSARKCERLQKDAIDDAEDRGVRANSQCQASRRLRR